MSIFKNITELELAELYASECAHWADCEESVSEAFDRDVAPGVIAQYGEDDEPAMSEAFNNWTDSLCTDGEIHAEQYQNYSYVGKYA